MKNALSCIKHQLKLVIKLVLELGLNFLTADDMSAILSAKLTRRLGFGMVTKMHLIGMHVEGKAAKSPALSYSHFISLPLAIHPELVDRVNKFQFNVLGRGDCSRAGGSGHAGKIDQSKNDLAAGVTLKVKDDTNRVAVDIYNIPTVSQAPKATILNELSVMLAR